MKQYKIFIYILIVCFTGAGCSKTLDLEPVSTISSSSFWKTEDDANGALRGMYIRFRNVSASNLYIWGESRSMNLKQSVGNDFTNIRFFNNTLDATVAGPDWSSVYRVVNDANLILKYLPGITFKSESAKNRLLAEAYTMRAYCYFIMAKTWGDLPLVLDPVEGFDPAVLYKERTAVADIFVQIKKDLAEAYALFPDNSFPAGRNRWSKPALNALIGDVYLWTAKKLEGGNPDFTTALNALTEAETADVSLLPEFERVFDYNNKGNKEILMASNFTRQEVGNTFMANMYIDAYPPNADPAAVAIIGTVAGGNYWTLTDQTRQKFSNEDQRKKATYTDLYSLDANTGQYTKYYGAIQRKFDGMIDGGARYFLDDVILYRFADVLLMKAEAQNALGQDPTEAMNKVRARAYGANFNNHVFVNGSKEQNDALILEERLLEFLYEGKYWWDILRFNKATELVPYFQANPSHTYKYLWPLSLNILSMEPKAVQNPGY